MQQQDKRVVSQSVSAAGYVLTICKTPRAPKLITVKPKGSASHQGRTNCFGVRV